MATRGLMRKEEEEEEVEREEVERTLLPLQAAGGRCA
jgi:hypothetical protein